MTSPPAVHSSAAENPYQLIPNVQKFANADARTNYGGLPTKREPSATTANAAADNYGRLPQGMAQPHAYDHVPENLAEFLDSGAAFSQATDRVSKDMSVDIDFSDLDELIQ